MIEVSGNLNTRATVTRPHEDPPVRIPKAKPYVEIRKMPQNQKPKNTVPPGVGPKKPAGTVSEIPMSIARPKQVTVVPPVDHLDSDSESEDEVEEIDRPFAGIKPLDVRPIHGNTGPKPVAPKPKEQAKTEPPKVVKGPEKSRTEMADKVVDRIMRGPVFVSVEELLKLSPATMKALSRKTRNRQAPVRTLGAHMVVVRDEENPLDSNTPESEIPVYPCLYVDTKDMASTGEFEVLEQDEGDLPKGSVVHRDITEQFKADLPPEAQNKIIIVASRSEGLRVVFPQINNKDLEVEVVLDSGSQIVSMATEVASTLGLTWDPDVVIHMQSANGQLQPTKGLARNVPFRFGELTVYMQLHIIDNPPYQVLLGRPFDSLTESSIQNYANGDQDVTITCPNSKMRSTIGTFTRGQPRTIRRRQVEPILRDATRKAPQEEGQANPAVNSHSHLNL